MNYLSLSQSKGKSCDSRTSNGAPRAALEVDEDVMDDTRARSARKTWLGGRRPAGLKKKKNKMMMKKKKKKKKMMS